MESFRKKVSAAVLPTYKNALQWAVIIFTEYHILWCLMRYAIWEFPYFEYEKRAGIFLIAAALIYLLLSVLTKPGFLRAAAGRIIKYGTFEHFFLTAFFFWYVFVCGARGYLEGADYFKDNDNALFLTWLSVFLFFPFAEYLGMKRARRAVEGMIHGTMLIYTTFSIWGLTRFFGSNETIMPSGNKITNYNGLMLGSNKNVTGAAAAVLFALCVYMIGSKHGWRKFLYIMAAFVHVFVLILSNARTSILASIIFITAAVLVGIWNRIGNRLINNGRMDRKQLVISAGAAAGFCIVFLMFFRKWAVTIVLASLGKTGALTVKDFTGLSNRELVWMAAVKVMFEGKKNFLFGVTPAYLPDAMYDTGLLYRVMSHAHNLLLHIGGCLGVPMMILYMGFLASLCIRGIRVLRAAAKMDPENPGIWIVPLIVMSLLIIEIAELMTFATYIVNLPVFYVFAGWLVSYDRRLNGRIQIPLFSKFRFRPLAPARDSEQS
ncbi:MAG: O-antigen ligase family protein [Lachnospiraceae bacterium]|nr:O-antigen ligase family protein [Lachnospiraceae bacterium]